MLPLVALLLLAGCGPSRLELRRAVQIAEARAPTAVSCEQDDACALASPLQALADRAFAGSTEAAPRHFVRLLEGGQQALLARIHMIRSARRSVDMQSFIYAEDDAGYFLLAELLAAARRGVRVRLLLDQLYSPQDVELLAHLSHAHANFAMRFYNPTFGEARTEPLEFAAGILCCFFRFNQRMHNKLLLVDGRIGLTGGRNVQNRYFDWDAEFNYRDRDLLVAGPVAGTMQESFDTFWEHPLSVPVAGLKDVAPLLLDPAHGDDGHLRAPVLTHASRILAMATEATDPAHIAAQLAEPALAVGRVEYISDLPGKPSREAPPRFDTGQYLRRLISEAEHEIVLQTPYLVLSRNARRLFAEMHARPRPPRVLVSSNSLAATDAFPVYALSHKYKRTYLREFGFDIYEYRPFPGDAPIDLVATGAGRGPHAAAAGEEADEDEQERNGDRNGDDRPRRGFRLFGSGRGSDGGLVPLERAGVRVSMHAKSLVLDAAIGIVGTHNFDPRSDHHNTESLVVVHDPAFARALRSEILRDITPENAWVIAPRPKPPLFSGLAYSFGKLFEQLPLFDFWPWRYATSWEYRESADCPPLPPDHPRFQTCYAQVGDFPGVMLEPKAIYTRILTAFGAGLAPIL